MLPRVDNPALLVGSDAFDDAAVYKLTDDIALVQTVDFFTPVVDDPYDFGRIAATNALSDIYAMGARPLTALNIACFPSGTLPLDYLAKILLGGADVVKEAGAVIVGGHTIDDPEPKYGLAVTGILRPGDELTNAAAKAGQLIILTKPLGTGIVATAIKQGKASPRAVQAATSAMTLLNRAAADVARRRGVRAVTDVTGFGLIGHLTEMCRASGVGAELWFDQVPFLPEAVELANQWIIPGGTKRNLDFILSWTAFDDRLDLRQQLLLADAQTSGGLVLAVDPAVVENVVQDLDAAGVTAAVIGRLVLVGDPLVRVASERP